MCFDSGRPLTEGGNEVVYAFCYIAAVFHARGPKRDKKVSQFKNPQFT